MAEEQRALTLWSGQHREGIIIEGLKTTAQEVDGAHLRIRIHDRKDLKYVDEFILIELDEVPKKLAEYSGNSDYLMFVATQGLANGQIIRGELLDFLDKNGGGSQLHKAVQVMGVLLTGFGYYNYCLASVMGTETGFEAAELNQSSDAFLPLKLLKFSDFYTPINTFPK